ncbi:MAG: MFS transporter, partial [Nitrospirae bacterium]
MPVSRSPLRGLLIAQFLGAFNDNAWKLLVTLLAIRQLAAHMAPGPQFEAASQAQTTLTFVVFTFPLIVVSLVAGVFSDRFSKRSVIVVLKAVEIVLMGVGTLALLANPSGGVWPLVVLAAMAVQSALFSPAKYGILPELLPHECLSAGNGQLELWTFLAIIAGTVSGGVLLDLAGSSPWLAGLLLCFLAVCGFLAALTVPPVPRSRMEGGVRATLHGAWEAVRSDSLLRVGIGGNIAYWTIASLVGQDVLIYAKAVLGLADSWVGTPLATFGFGVGLGSILAGILSSAKVEMGLIPVGVIGLVIPLCLMGMLSPALSGTLAGMAFLGLASGLIVVPFNALIQWRAPHDRKGAVIAFSNTLVFAGILIGSLGAGGLAQLGLDASGILTLAGLGTAGLLVLGVRVFPEMAIRMVLVLLSTVRYRLTVIGKDHVPLEGGGVLVVNRMSLLDALLILASVDRSICFVGELPDGTSGIFRRAAKSLRVLSPEDVSSGTKTWLSQTACIAMSGELVCILSKGPIPARNRVEELREALRGSSLPLLPVYLERPESLQEQGALTVRHLREPALIAFGAPIPSDASPAVVQDSFQQLGSMVWNVKAAAFQPLHRLWIGAMRRHPFKFAFADLTRPHVTCLGGLIGVIVLAKKLRPIWAGQSVVGILLPPSVAGVLVNVAVTLSGRTSVNLNYT